MNNAFLVLRTVFFALLMYFHVLILIFASWNIAAASTSGMPAPGASAFLLMNTILIFVLVPMAYFAELICARARPGHVRVECAWTALMAVFQLAASIAVTVNGPPVFCLTNSPWAMCASSSLLVHTSWFATLIILSYCLTICIAAVTHATSLPDIWITAVQHVPWFSPRMVETPAPANTSRLPTDKHAHARTASAGSSASDASCAISKYIAERWEKLSRTERQSEASGPILFSRGCQSIDATRPSWARSRRTRRGIDNPFAKPLPMRQEQPAALVPPPRTYSRHVGMMPRSVESGDSDSEQLEPSTRASSTLFSRTPIVFPQRIADPDLPVPRPGSLSGWVRADALCAESVPSL